MSGAWSDPRTCPVPGTRRGGNGQRLCGSTSTTAVRPARRIAGAAAEDMSGARHQTWRERSEALRVDVDDGGQAGSAHRRGGGGEELSGAGGEAARFVRLRDELGPVAAAQAEQRRR